VVKRGEDTRIVSLVAYLYAAEQKLTMLSWLAFFVISCVPPVCVVREIVRQNGTEWWHSVSLGFSSPLCAPCAPCQSLFGRRARLLHHFHQNFPGLSRTPHLAQKCDAGATHAIRSLQPDMKTQAIDRCQRCFR
jgi:hypothetical protein